MTLLTETISKIESSGKKESEVLWCGSREWGWFTWEEFKKLSDLYYDGGFGAQKVAGDLLIVAADWWLERHEYDGSEWWELKETPKKPDVNKTPKRLIGGMWEDLTGLNNL